MNCEFPENTTITDIRKAGMIALRSIGENKADFRVLSEQLDQTQTKVLMDSLKEEIFHICAMPNRSDGRNYDTTGAAQLASLGWYQADCSARNTEDLFKESNRQFDRILSLTSRMVRLQMCRARRRHSRRLWQRGCILSLRLRSLAFLPILLRT